MYARLLVAHWLAVVLFLTGAPSTRAQDSNRIGVAEQIRTITSRIKSTDDRKQAEKALRKFDVATVLEMVFPEIERWEEEPDGAVPFRNYFLPFEELPPAIQALLSLQGLWSDLIHEPSPNQGALLLTLLKTAKTDTSRLRAISGFWYHFIPDAEAPLAAILREKKAVGWSESAAILLHHMPEKYGPVLVDHLENEKEPLSGRIALFRDFGVASFERMGEKDRKRFIRSGFALIEAERRAHPTYQGAGYFPAVWLQAYLKVKLPRPSQDDPKYRTPDGNNLNRAFFEDTARNALDWWAVHRKDYE